MAADGDVSDLLRDLLRPEAFGQSSTSPVRLKTTHASWVFIVGDDVWKVKRPVSFGFLDFRTLDARRRACEAEVRLNRRLAPDVYLGAVPVRTSPAGHTICGDGPVMDWAVHMRRLPDDASAEALLARGQLGARMLESVAEKLATFFTEAHPAPELGTIAALIQNVSENFAEVAPFVSDLLERETLDEVRAFQSRELDRKAQHFVARVIEGRIREGHGDLRLEHVYLLPDKAGTRRPVIIDCVEFNERFRCGDTAAEVAFLAMELEAADQHDLASGFLARYAEASDDFGLFGVVDFYSSYRAWVRGKVAAFVATDPTTELDVRKRKRVEARRDFGLARSFAGRPLYRPFLIIVGGVIGSGKSTLASALGRALAAPVISSDRTRKRMAGIEPTTRAEARLYDEAQRDRTYAEIVRHAAIVLGSGRGVILDATWSARRWRQMAADTARANDADFALVEARCVPPEALRARLAARREGKSISDARDELLDEFLRHYELLAASDPAPQLSIDTSAAPEAALYEALRQLRTVGIVPPSEQRGL